MIIFTVFAFNFAGDGLRDSLGQPENQEVLAR
jgi:peptide/nickel transport system permease protein